MTATLLTPTEFRQHVETALEDDAIQRLLDSAEDDINDHCGRLVVEYDEPNEVTQWFTNSEAEVVLRTKQALLSVTSVTEVTEDEAGADIEEDLEADVDFWVDDAGAIRRKSGFTFGPRVRVVYVPVNTTNRRRATLINLVKLEINADPGTGFEGASTWQHTTQDYETQRQHLLWALCPPPVLA